MTQRFLGLIATLLLTCAPSQANAGTFQFGSTPAELVLSEISPITVRIQLIPLDEQGQLRSGPPATVLTEFPSVERYRARELTGQREVRVGTLRILLTAEPFAIAIRRENGQLVQEFGFTSGTNPTISFHTDAPVLGLGEGDQQFDRRGALYRMINGQLGATLATHGATIPVPYLLGTDGWSLFLNGIWGQFDLRGGQGKFLTDPATVGHAPLDLFLTASAEPAGALGEFIRLTGHPVMPPKWVMGYLQSHRTLASPTEALEVARTFRAKNLPCDALIYLGTGYCPAGWNLGHGSLEFNPRTFDRPAENLRALHDLNFKVVLHINHAPRAMFGTSLAEVSDSPLHIRNYWARHHETFALGVDAWWPDDGDELPIEARLARHRCYFEGPLLDRPNVRSWSLHRNGYAGVARYGGWIWSGDVESRWATLAAHVPIGLNYSLSLTPFWGTDTGGFIPTREFTGELYARWFQFSAFTPLFRSHGRTWQLRLPWGWNTGQTGPVEERVVPAESELHNAAIEPICKKYLELRYRLLPYNYTLMRAACDTGVPPMRALWLHYPRDAEAVKLGDEYLWGRDLLVAPVVEKGATMLHLYLPAGTWYDWWTGEKVSGQRWLDRPVDLATMPIYARAGAVVPLDPVRQFTAENTALPTTLTVFPGANGEFVLYEDDGVSLDYQQDRATWTRLTWNDETRALTITPDARSKGSPLAVRKFLVTIAPNGARQSVDYHGNATEVRF